MGSWICRNCGTSNTGRFCLTCGEPDGFSDWNAEREERRRIEELYGEHGPSLAQAKALPQKHGNLTAVSFSGSSSGMMVNSYTSYARTLELAEDGTCTLTDTDESGMTGNSRTVYRADPAVLEKIGTIVTRENMAAWQYLREVLDPRFRPTDFSASSGLTLTFDDRSVGGRKSASCSINTGAASQQGAGGVLDEIRSLMETCRTPENVLSREKSEAKKPFGMMGFMGMGMMGMGGGGAPGPQAPEPQAPEPPKPAREPAPGNWICPLCGAENAGKFCSECGSRRPEDVTGK